MMRISLTAFLIILALPVLAQPNSLTLDIGTDTASFGQTATIPVTMELTGAAPATLFFRVNYDPLRLVFQGLDRGATIPSGSVVDHQVGASGVGVGIYGSAEIPAGLLVTLRFTVISPDQGSIALTGANGSAATTQAVDIAVNFRDGNVNVGSGSSISCSGARTSAGSNRALALDVSAFAVVCALLVVGRRHTARRLG